MHSLDAITAMKPVVAEFRRLCVRYYVGGSIASIVYGQSRSTIDVDLIADLGPEHVAPLVEALHDEYYISEGMIVEAIARKSGFNLIHLPTSFKVDVFIVKDREYDRVALQRIRSDSLEDEDPSAQFFVASAEDIVLSKLEWFRLGHEVSERQWIDVLGVLKVQQNALDRAYLTKWATELDVADLLKRAWKEAEA